MKNCGIIGGLGPDTTAKFYGEFIRRADRLELKSRPGVLIWSVSLDYEVEREAIVHGRGLEALGPMLTDAAKRLEAGGADYIIMPCNSLHIFINEIRAAVQVPVISIVEETARQLKEEKASCVAVLGTRITTKNGLYESALKKENILTAVPGDSELEALGEVIHRLVMGEMLNSDRRFLSDLVSNLEEKGVSHILLACTDLQILCGDSRKAKIVDTFQVLLNAALREAAARPGCHKMPG